ncbi:hypothetical protein [Paraburkholderia sp. BCC1876]|uniref:hypothetical protein n=1 Tax=Paraburkholderia sp. BCC1876 TaxID=2676303 RepID=UPI0015912C02|nr:hypothetical protein [Paraburkholderia sp. BCC1876]
MKLSHELDAACKRIGKALHLNGLKSVSGERRATREAPACGWVIVYRTAQGFCCMYEGAPIEFDEMLDVQIWSEEMEVQTYFIGL